MTRSATDICNIAFEALREPEIADIDNGTLPIHRGARRQFNRAHQAVMESRNWQIATTQAELAVITSPAINGQVQDEFSSYYQLPGDFAKVVALPKGTAWGQRGGPGKGWIGANRTGALRLIYVRLIDPAEMTEALATVVGLRMAWQLAPVQSKDRPAKDALKSDYLLAYRNAALADNGHRSAVPVYESPWLTHMDRY